MGNSIVLSSFLSFLLADNDNRYPQNNMIGNPSRVWPKARVPFEFAADVGKEILIKTTVQFRFKKIFIHTFVHVYNSFIHY